MRWESLPAAGSLQACAQHLAGETKSRLLRAIIQFAKENPSSIDEFVKHIKPSTVDVDIESLLQSEMINAKLTEKERINERKQKEAEINKKLNKERNEKREERLRLERHTGRGTFCTFWFSIFTSFIVSQQSHYDSFCVFDTLCSLPMDS